MNLGRTIAMPNEILLDVKKLLENGTLKSSHHQEFLYSYYWLVTYLWRYSMYTKHNMTQATLKGLLGYNSNEKRINYIIKKGGVLDDALYTETVKDFPVSWRHRKGGELSLDMLYSLHKSDVKMLTKHMSPNYTIKKPVKHMGDGDYDGLFWNPSNTHMMSGEYFKACMEDSGLGCSGFYLLGILTFIRDKSREDVFMCSNRTLSTYTQWSERKISRLTNRLSEAHLISKGQDRKNKGSVNKYRIISQKTV